MSTIKVRYTLDCKNIETISVNKNYTVNDFIDQIKENKDNNDINCVYLNGRVLPGDDLLTNHFKDYRTQVLIVSDDDSKGPEDFPAIDAIDPDEKAEKIIETLTSTKHDVPGATPSSTFKMKVEFKVFTTATERSFINGDKITFKVSDNYETISNKIRELITEWHVPGIPEDFQTHIFLPGGVPFLPGDDPAERTLESYYDATEVSSPKLYVVVTRDLGDQIDNDVPEPCNCRGSNKNMLSPLFDSSTAGLTQIASFLGYLFHDGINGEHLMLVFAKITRFAPLIVNMFRLLEHAELNVLNIIAITGPLFTLFKSILPAGIDNESVFEYTLKVITFIGLLKDTEYLSLKVVDYNEDEVEGEDELCDYFRSTHQQHHVIVWEDDTTKPGFQGFNIDRPEGDTLISDESSIFEAVKTYKPVAPLSLHYIHHPTFVSGDKENEVLLYLNEVPGKADWIRYIDPKESSPKECSIDDLARKVHNSEKEDFLSLIDGNLVDQIIVICFDESTSMKWKLEGGNPRHGEPTRAQISTQFLRALVQQSFRLRVSSIYGLISFGSEVKTLQNLTAMSSQFTDSLKEIKPNGQTVLYDALKKAHEMIMDLITPAPEEEEEEAEESQFPNAALRIIVISDGVDNKSAATPTALLNSFIEHGIRVDTVLVSTIDKNNEMCALSKLTGGLCFKPENLQQGLKIFEQEAFLNIKMRHLTKTAEGEISEEQLEEEAAKFKDYDKQAPNQEVEKAKTKISLATPLYMDYFFKSKREVQSMRVRRVLRELNIIGHNPSDKYVVYSSQSTPEEWRIFIKGPSGTPFANKWLNCFMCVPPSFPSEPPSFRFLTIPFHPNVSQEGAIVFSLSDKEYTANTPIDSIIDGIVDLLKNPEENTFINSEASELYKRDKDAFRKRQEEGETGCKDYHEYIKDVKVYDDVPEGAETPEEERLSQLYVTNVYGKATGKVLPNPDPDGLYD